MLKVTFSYSKFEHSRGHTRLSLGISDFGIPLAFLDHRPLPRFTCRTQVLTEFT